VKTNPFLPIFGALSSVRLAELSHVFLPAVPFPRCIHRIGRMVVTALLCGREGPPSSPSTAATVFLSDLAEMLDLMVVRFGRPSPAAASCASSLPAHPLHNKSTCSGRFSFSRGNFTFQATTTDENGGSTLEPNKNVDVSSMNVSTDRQRKTSLR